jgi:3D (Asp-Asp-Asp) domain-containing protein
MTTMLGAALLLLSARAEGWCADMRVTGYSRLEHGPRTFDGTPIWTDEPIAAASWDIPIDSVVIVEGLGRYRVADRGSGLGNAGWIDIAVWDRPTAYSLTGTRRVCVWPPEAR